MRFEHSDSRYSRYARAPKAQSKRLVMYAVLLVAVVVAMIALRNRGRASIEWLPTFEEATARAQADGKPIMAFFYVKDNDDCRRMDRETFAHETVRTEAGKFVCVRIDGAAHPELAERFLVAGHPAVVFISPEGGHIQTELNSRTAQKMVGHMREALDRWKRRTLSQSPALPPKTAEPAGVGDD
jgi:thiol:disulfide interchange protein